MGMWTLLALTVGVMGFIMLAMAVGVIFGRSPLKGSCGGVGGDCACEDQGLVEIGARKRGSACPREAQASA